MSKKLSNDESFLCVLDEAKAIYTRKSKESEERLKENEQFQEEVVQLKIDKETLILNEESLTCKMKVLEEKFEIFEKALQNVTTQLTNSKSFMKNFFTQLRSRITDIEEKGIYNADTFDYLIGDVGRSLCNTSFAVSPKKSPQKKQLAVKLSTNKDKKRIRYKNIAPIDLTNNTKPNKQDIQNKVTLGHVAGNTNLKKYQPSATITENINPHIKIDPSKFLDPDSTLRSPIGPPSRASTPQGPLGDLQDLETRETSAEDFRPSSPSILPLGVLEDIKSPLLSQLLLLFDDEIPEETEPQSPTIPSRSHSLSKSRNGDGLAQERKRKRPSLDLTFGSLLAEPVEQLKAECPVGDARGHGRHSFANERQQTNRKDSVVTEQQRDIPTSSPELVILEDDDDFVKPGSVLTRKMSCSGKEIRAETSSLLLFSPQRNKSPVIVSSSTDPDLSGKQESRHLQNESVDDDKSKLAFKLNLDESAMEENQPENQRSPLEKEKRDGFKYVEVVRGKDKRAKLNGYFCADCEKYYGSLKLSAQEIQERLKACSRHRARFTPPPSTPEHFWEVDFMNTHDYIEKGYLRKESDLPPEKRRLKSHKTKGKLKYNNE